MPEDTGKGAQGGQLEGNPPEKFYGDCNDTSNFLIRFKQFTVGFKSVAMFCSFRLYAVWRFMEWKSHLAL
jgi:hypothetical protein